MVVSKEEMRKLDEDCATMFASLPETINAGWQFIKNIKESLKSRPSEWDKLETGENSEDKYSVATLLYHVYGDAYLFFFRAASPEKEIELHTLDEKTLLKFFITIATTIHDGSIKEEVFSIDAQNDNVVYNMAVAKNPSELKRPPFELRVHNPEDEKERMLMLREIRFRDSVAAVMTDHIIDSYKSDKESKRVFSGTEYLYMVSNGDASSVVIFNESEKTEEPDGFIYSEMRQALFDALSEQEYGVYGFDECGIEMLVFSSDDLEEISEE